MENFQKARKNGKINIHWYFCEIPTYPFIALLIYQTPAKPTPVETSQSPDRIYINTDFM
jgi:hypothetical protein